MGTTAPSGWLLCNGAVVSRTTYASLFAVIGTSGGSGDGATTFVLPDLNGVFLRGADLGAGRDPDRAARVAMHTGGNTGDSVGSYEADAFQGHYHEMEYANNAAGPGLSRPYYAGTGVHLYSAADPALGKAYQVANDGTHGSPRAGFETRPVNVSVNYIIKY